MTREETVTKLYECVQTRPKPEDVAELVLAALRTRLSVGQTRTMGLAARHSMKNALYGWSSMAADFHRPVGAEKQIKVASELFGARMLSAADCLDPDKVEAFVVRVSKAISKTYGASDFLKHRLNRTLRKAQGLVMGHRAYNKRFRLLGRIEGKVLRMAREEKKYLLTRVGKGGFAVEIPFEDFAADLSTACFVAYLSARMGRRSEFTNGPQSRAYDTVAAMLYGRLTHSQTTRWDVVAAVHPVDQVLGRLTDFQKGAALARAWKLLEDASGLLEEVWRTSGDAIDLKRMVVRRGCDSSTWNQSAGGWNKARDHWVSMLHSLGMSSVMEALCPGKVMRLMAADVARWHQASGGDVHPATKVWAELPYPWEVVRGLKACTRVLVEAACIRNDVDPETWVGPKRVGKAERFEPTPELVHGVTVSSPSLAAALRKAGVFSGQEFKPEHLPSEGFSVVRDEHGAALKVEGENQPKRARKSA